jgi:hypothetical protein
MRYRGVTETSYGGTWFVRVRHQGKQHYLGTFLDPVEAAQAYDRAVLQLRGKAAKLNFPSLAGPHAPHDLALDLSP